MIDITQRVLNKLIQKGIHKNNFFNLIDAEFDKNTTIDILQAQGLPIIENNNILSLKTSNIKIDEAEFSIFDIETNGSKPSKDQIIEIGIVKFKNNTIIDVYESLVHANYLPKNIAKITSISLEDLQKAPKLSTVIQEVKSFIQDTTLIAHNAKFDYKFLSEMMKQNNLGQLHNRHFCSIDLAERTIQSKKYGLQYLNDTLNLHSDATHHRALSDAITTTELFKIILQNLPKDIKSVEDLILFSKQGKRLKYRDENKEERGD